MHARTPRGSALCGAHRLETGPALLPLLPPTARRRCAFRKGSRVALGRFVGTMMYVRIKRKNSTIFLHVEPSGKSMRSP